MRCNQAQFLISLNLDGRLASGQRQLLLAHLDECEACNRLQGELEAGQAMALGLPEVKVSTGFREQLWDRIRAGEGSPDAIFHEPIPFATKLTWFATGAVAAGLMILVAHFVGPEEQAPPPSGRTEARAGDGSVSRSTGKQPAASLAMAPATPERIAQAVAEGYSESVQRLRERARSAGAGNNGHWIEEVRTEADRAAALASTLRWFVDRKYMKLDQEEASKLATVELVSRQVRELDDPAALKLVVKPLTEQPRNRVHNFLYFFCSPCVEDEDSFHDEFAREMQRAPQLARVVPLQVQVLDNREVDGSMQPRPTGRIRLYISR